ncbi:MAG: extracellular solute-binding protein [Desulfobacterales bacterium]
MAHRLPIYQLIFAFLCIFVIDPVYARPPSHGLAYFGNLRYARDFPHFDYANPDAPKGGRMRAAEIGTFNNLHPFVSKGIPAAGIAIIYDPLMKESLDELRSVYANLAESAELADDYSSVAFTLREGAYWHDGMPITVEDVIWTFNTIKEKASVGWKSAYKDVLSVEAAGPRTVRFSLRKSASQTPQLALHIAAFRPLPKHYWKDKDFGVTTLDPPLGSGPYRVKTVDVGHRIVYERVENYWGKDVSTNVGHNNFDEIEFNYFLDKNLVIQALKSGLIDYKNEPNAEDFATAYDFWGLREGFFIKEMLQLNLTYGMDWGIVFNTRIEKLGDVRVREALALAYNFEWANRVLWHDFKKRNISYFIQSGLAAEGLPSAEELVLLEPFRDQVPERVFTHAFTLPENDPYGRNRGTLLQANALLESAGWVVKDSVRVNRNTGEPFSLEFITSSVAELRMLSPYAENLKRLGIDSRLRRLDANLMTNRVRQFDFEAMVKQIWLNNIPYAYAIRSHFQSDNADRPNMWNYAGIKDPVVDYLIDKVVYASSEAEMNTAGRALDRVLLWSFYLVPGGYPGGRKFVYWDRFGSSRPEKMKSNGWPLLWWLDKEKNARTDAAIAAFRKKSAEPKKAPSKRSVDSAD